MIKRSIMVLLSLLLILSSATVVLAGKKDDEKGKGYIKNQTKNELKELWKQQKDAIEETKDELEKIKDELEAQYEAAKESGDEELAAQLKSQLDEAWQNFKQSKDAMHQVIRSRKETVRSSYTEEELEQIREATEKLQQEDPEARILSFDSIFSDTAKFKFDTPPVIKSGRTLVPVRAITEGFGAEVGWNSETRQVSVTSGAIEIVLTLDTNTAIVNGEETTLDVTSGVKNNRTYVPLRFILETFGLEVDWDSDTETIEINDPTEDETVNDNTDETADDATNETTNDATDDTSDDANSADPSDTSDDTTDAS